MTLSFIIITWNSEKYIKQCVESYLNSLVREGLDAEFIIIDNGSTDDTLKIINKKIKRMFKNKIGFNIQSIPLNANFGTTISRNKGLNIAKGDFIVICDSDTQFLEGKWKNALSYISSHTDVAILSPLILYGDGTFQNSIKKFPTIKDKISKLIKIFFKMPVKETDFYTDINFKEVKNVDTAISAFWLIKKETLMDVGLFDEKIFYSPEDIDYCLRAWEGGRKVIFYPWFKITHYCQQLSHQKPLSRQSLSHFFGLLYYFKKHKYWFSRKRLMQRLKNPNQKIKGK